MKFIFGYALSLSFALSVSGFADNPAQAPRLLQKKQEGKKQDKKVHVAPPSKAKVQAKTLRKDGETKAQMFKRLFTEQKRRDPLEKNFGYGEKIQEFITAKVRNKKIAANKGSKGSTSHSSSDSNSHNKRDVRKNFKNFEGFWQLNSIDDFEAQTVIEFFMDKGKPYAKFYDGTQNNPREVTPNDAANENLPASTVGTVIPVEVLGPKSIRFLNNGPILSKDDLTSTFRIQDEDQNLAYVMFWTAWDGTGDSPKYGVHTELSRFIRLADKPDIQLNRLPSLEHDWTNPVEMFAYIAEYYELMGEPQKAQSLEQENFIGWPAYEALQQTMLTTGLIREAEVSTAYRGGNYIGVWRTQYPADFPLTTITTADFHHMNQCSTVEISGFLGAYAVLNGVQKVAAFPPSSVSLSTQEPWQDATSREQYLHIIYDSSGISESYDPNIHGVATLVAQHGPITPDIGYRDFMAAVIDFAITSFGGTTHTGIYFWVNNEDGISVPETFDELQMSLANDAVSLIPCRTRTYVANGFSMYWNPALTSSLNIPAFNLNDPFGLGLAPFLDAAFDYDIVLENYLDRSTVKNIFFTVTGKEDPEQPITSMLVDQGYTSNGSKVVFKANDFQTFPAPLVDKYGTHEWMQYNWIFATNSTGADPYASIAFYGGIVRPEFSDGKTVAYLRVADESAFDEPVETLTVRSLAFGRKDIKAKYLSNNIAAWASLIEELNKYQPDRYIIDIRNNGGGFEFSQTWGTLFGGDRVGAYVRAIEAPGNGYSDPTVIPGSGIQTVFHSIPPAPEVLQCDEAARVFPYGVVRSTTKEIELIILDSSHAASSGDIFPHNFLGPDPDSTVHDLGRNVTARIIGDIDGRLYSSAKQRDGLPINTLSHNLVDANGLEVTATYMRAESGRLYADRNGYLVNPMPATVPNVLLPGWYDQTEWQDIGVAPIIEAYPLGLSTKPAPDYNDRTTWRDIWLEHAITD